MRDRAAGTTVRVVPGSNFDVSAPQLTPDGRFVALRSYNNLIVPSDTATGDPDAFVIDLYTAERRRVSVDAGSKP